MKLIEQVCGLFPYEDYTYPEGEYKIKFRKKIYTAYCREVVLLRKEYFDYNNDFKKFYETVKGKSHFFVTRLPYPEDSGVLVYENNFKRLYKSYCKNREDNFKRIISKLVSFFYCLCVSEDHYFDETAILPMDYVNNIRGQEKEKESKQAFFTIARDFHEYVMILRAPYVNAIDVNYLHLKGGMFSYFCTEDGNLCSTVDRYRFSYFQPKPDGLEKKVRNFFDKEENIPIEDLFLSKSKVYLRMHNYSMAIIHVVIALDVVVPQFLNEYLKLHGVNKEAVQDFNNKFGLSV